MTDVELFDAFARYQEGRSLSPHTVKRRRMSLGLWQRHMAPASITTATGEDVDEFLARLNSPATRHAYRSDLTAFYRWAGRRGLTDSNPLLMTDPVKVPRGLPRPVPAEVLAEALRIASGRIQVALLLGALAGLRVTEIASLHTDDLMLDEDLPLLCVREGKGGKDRMIPVHPDLLPRLRGLRSGWVFKSQKGPSHVAGVDLGKQIRAVLTQASGGRRYTTHTLRHYFGSQAARWSEGNLLLVRDLLGHGSLATSERYMAWTPTDGAAVVARITAGDSDELAERRRRNVS